MAVNKKFLTGTDIGLMAGIAVLSLGGVSYAALSGVVNLPGVKPILTADKPISNARPSLTLPSPNQPTGVEDSATLTDNEPNPLATVAEASPSPLPSPNPSPSPSPSPTPPPPTADELAAARDKKRKEDLAAIAVALKLYKDKNKGYPVVNSYMECRTDSPSTPLHVLVEKGYIKELPIDPKKDDGYWYGCVANATSYKLTARLERTTDPEGQYTSTKPPLYLYTLSSP